MKKILLSLLVSLILLPLTAFSAVNLKAGHPNRYVVQPGDTLWGISGKFLEKPWQWKSIWHANPQIKNPDDILPGAVLVLNSINGRPSLVMARNGMIRLSPRIRKQPLNTAIPPIPLSVIRPFLTGSQVLDTDELSTAPYIVAYQGEHIAAGTGHSIYVNGLHGKIDQRYSIYRKNGYYKDPETKQILGYTAEHIGDARLTKNTSPATLLITSAQKEAHPGDRVLPAPKNTFKHWFVPQAPERNITGEIIDLMGAIDQIGDDQIAVINQGKKDGLRAGDVLAIYQPSRSVPDPIHNGKEKGRSIQLPEERVGEMMVFRAFSHVSYGLVMRAVAAIHQFDLVKNP